MRAESMVALGDNFRVHVHGEKKGVAKTEETRNIVQSVQQIEAKHHEPARVGGRHLVVAPGVAVPRPFCIPRAGDSQECVRRDMDRLSGELRNMITVRTICEHRAREEREACEGQL